jgi:Domain of unknown function (DUF5655)
MPEKYVAAKTISLKAHQEYTEKWLQQIIADDPIVLGLGELEVRDAERPQPYAGRLDLLLVDPESRTRYEVEIQLGATDESHIIRTIEYWDNERRRYPDREHVAVIVAEDITSRFLNIISLFNRAIPLVAIQLRALEVGGVLTLHATKVLDLTVFPAEEEEAEHEESADRAYWEKRGAKQTVSLADRLRSMIHEVTGDTELAPKYNRHYIGLARHGIVRNFVTMRPRKTSLIAEFKIPRSDELSARLDDAGFDTLPYDTRWNNYRLRLTAKDFATREEVLADLIRQASGSGAGE